MEGKKMGYGERSKNKHVVVQARLGHARQGKRMDDGSEREDDRKP